MNEPASPREAVVPIVIHDDRVLVIKRGPNVVMSGYWCPPSGRIEPGETQEQAVVRESAEELGLDVTPVAKVWECPTDDGSFTLHWWTATAPSNDVRPDPGEVAETRWVTAQEFLELRPSFEGDKRFFLEVLPDLVEDDRARGGLTRLGESGENAGRAHDE